MREELIMGRHADTCFIHASLSMTYVRAIQWIDTKWRRVQWSCWSEMVIRSAANRQRKEVSGNTMSTVIGTRINRCYKLLKALSLWPILTSGWNLMLDFKRLSTKITIADHLRQFSKYHLKHSASPKIYDMKLYNSHFVSHGIIYL